MEQNRLYFRISELVKMAKLNSTSHESKCDQALAYVEQTFRLIDEMTNDDRQQVIDYLTGWMLVEKFELKGQSALAGIRRYCIANCLFEDPMWLPPNDVASLG